MFIMKNFVKTDKSNSASTPILGRISYNSDTSYGDNGSWTAHGGYVWDSLDSGFRPDKDKVDDTCGSCHSYDGDGFHTDYSDINEGAGGSDSGGW